MDELVDATIQFIERCERHVDQESLSKEFLETIKLFNFKYFLMGRLPSLGEEIDSHVLAVQWPQQWMTRYTKERYFWSDPVSTFAYKTNRPFTWAEARRAEPRTRIAQKIASEARAFGLRDGLVVPVSDAGSLSAAVSLASERPVRLDAAHRTALQLICYSGEAKMADLHDRDQLAVRHLSQREREVLRWIANGKTHWETSVILDVTEDTVKAHAMSARKKLGASTTPQAVARALSTRQLVL
ncbi:transcriptional regulator [Devosia pacifica]|uniref:Transcriptional regulator n=1 Tax=Devosia pacifica TaxID=1335967 RepID=A0A918S850_9HYPH|nr:LuxR family transcriptional regulator [Devosia pacifica]GHA29765.1 transcriptional regulator [Devosia pacifica]